jgi:hypothetical protein
VRARGIDGEYRHEHRRRGNVVWGWLTWIAVAVAAWVVVAALVGVLLGRAVRHRDQQVPHDDVEVPFPTPRRAAGSPPPVPERRPHT